MNTINNIWSPLDQFEIRSYLSIDAPIFFNTSISLTNIGLYILISAFIIVTYHVTSTNKNIITWNIWSIVKEALYGSVHSIVINQINYKKGHIFFPFIYTIFIFILVNNLVGMVPYSFAVTSHFILTFALSFSIVLGSTIIGLYHHGLEFFSLFVPSGCPMGLLPLLVLIEFISYLSRNVSLGLRLAANIVAGHMLLSILSNFTYKILLGGAILFILGLLPLAFIIAFSALEIGITLIQAQVFVVLTCSYINDCMELH